MRRPLIGATILVLGLMGAYLPSASGQSSDPSSSTTLPSDEGTTTTTTPSTTTPSTTSAPPTPSTAAPGPVGALAAVSGPLTPVDEAPDFSTIAWGDPWDMANKEDLLTDGFGPTLKAALSGFGNSLFSFTLTGDGYISPLWGGIPKTLLMGRDGILAANRIDANKYKYLSIRMKTDTPLRSAGIFWTNCGKLAFPCSGGMGASFAGNGDGNFRTYTFKLEKFAPFGDPDWTGSMQGLRLAFNAAAGTAPRVQIDWIRLYEPEQIPGSRSLSGVAPGDTLFYSDAAPGGASCEQLLGNGNNDLGALPPGTFSFWSDAACAAPAVPVIINARPTPIVTSPSMAGGNDYATNVLKNPWDFNSSNDLKSPGGSSNTCKAPGVVGVSFTNPLGAVSGFNCASNGFVDDPQIFMKVGGGGFAIPSYIYHRATVTFTYDGSYNLTSGCHGGTIARLVWFDTLHPGKVMQTKGWLTYKDRSVFTFDMASGVALVNEENVGNKNNFVLPKGHYIKVLRWDANEDKCARRYRLHDVKLRADNQPNGLKQVKIDWYDPRAEVGDTVTIFVRNTSVAGSPYVTIASGLANSSSGTSRTWNTAGFMHGKYQVLVRVMRAGGLTGDFFATGPVAK